MLALIAAIDPNNVIGHNNTIPWNIPEERQLFHELTEGHPVIMGRKTFESLPHPLKNRTNIILTKQISSPFQGEVSASFNAEGGVFKKSSLPQALHQAQEISEKIFIIGGGELYRQTIGLADTLYISHLKMSHPGDTYFPEINPKHWQATRKKEYAEFRIVIYKRT